MFEQRFSSGISRRNLLKTGTAAAALVLGGGSTARALADGGRSHDGTAHVGDEGPVVNVEVTPREFTPREYLLETYESLVGTTMRIERHGLPALPVTLVEAKPLGVTAIGSSRSLPTLGQAFSLLLRAHGRPEFTGGVYNLVHPQLGSASLFISPVGRGVHGQGFQVVVNRVVPVGEALSR